MMTCDRDEGGGIMTERKRIELPHGFCRLNKCGCPGTTKKQCGPNVDYTACPHYLNIGVKYAYQTTDADGTRRIHLEASEDAKPASKETRDASSDRDCQLDFLDLTAYQEIKGAGMS